MHLFRLSALAVLVLASVSRADDWPQWMGPNRDDNWRETGILDKFPAGGPKVLWRTKIHYGYAGPAVADGLVYVPDYVTDVDLMKRAPFTRMPPVAGKERLLCLDAKTGKEVWKDEYDCPYTISYAFGPRCTPTVHGGKVYSLGSEGNLRCLDAKTGKLLWENDFKKDYGAETAMWGYAGHPLVDGQKLICIVGGKDALAVAFDKDTGKEVWKSLETPKGKTGYSPPTLIESGGQRQLLIWSGEKINSLDPETGKPYWSHPLETGGAMSIMAPRQSSKYLFAGGRESMSVLLELGGDKPGATQVWKGNRDTGVGPINMTPFVEDGVIYGVEEMGELRGIDLATGKKLWGTTVPVTGKEKTQARAGTVFLTKNGDRFFLFSDTGHLIIARLDREGYHEIDRWNMLEPTTVSFGTRIVVWSHPAFADKCVFARNDKEIVCASLAK
jgi:outer membrane protein assembly factor BamB